jgi:hypothetical protein
VALFNSSPKPVSAVVSEIADSAGASADPEQTTRAWRSLKAGIQYFNTRANWDFLFTEANPIKVFAPYTVILSASAGNSSATLAVGHGVSADDYMVGDGIQTGTRVTATGGTSLGFNQIFTITAAGIQTITASGNRDMYALPSDWKMEYSARLLGSSPRWLRDIRRRAYDRSVSNEQDQAVPMAYDTSTVGGKGKVRLLRPPAAADVLQLRYYRRMTVPTASAATEVLDIPEDYENFLIAWSKWHYLTDRGDGRADQANVWLGLATEGIKVMLADQVRKPDEDLMFTPGASTMSMTTTPNTVTWWDYW